MTFEQIVHNYKEFLVSQNCSDRTIDSYGSYAKRFINFLQKYYPRVMSVEMITTDVLMDYQNYLSNYEWKNGELLSISTQRLLLRALKNFFRYLVKKDLILKDLSVAITLPREEQRVIRNVLSEKEVLRVLDRIRCTDPLKIRNRAIVELLYSCGIRTSELCTLRIQDVDLKEQTVTIIKGKGNKSRIVPIGQYAVFYIQMYLDKARKYMLRGKRTDPGILFLSQRGNPFNKSTINKTVIQSVMRQAKLKKPISCYTFRHSVATHLLANKVDVMYIAKLLGHASLKTTQNYLRVEITDLKKMHSLYHPRETKNLNPTI